MRQIVEVKRLLDPGYAEIFMERTSACSGDCHRCSGCGAAKETIFVRAENTIGAEPGERVILESDTKTVFGAVFLVYAMPMILFFAGYALGAAAIGLPGLWGAVGFGLGLIPAILWNRRLEKKKAVRFRIVGYAQD